MTMPTKVASRRSFKTRLQSKFIGVRGVNIVRPFVSYGAYDLPTMTAQWYGYDLAKITTAGFDHVRIAIHESSVDATDKKGLIVNAIQECLDEGLSVILDLHPSNSYKSGITGSTSNHSAATSIITYFAQAASDNNWPDTKFALQLLNEPGDLSGYYWLFVENTIAAVRAILPTHSIIVNAVPFGGYPAMAPFPAGDYLIAAIHYYGEGGEFVYTHQGATWLGSSQDGIEILGNNGAGTIGIGLKFPYDAANITAVNAAINASSFTSKKAAALALVASYEACQYGGRSISDWMRECNAWKAFHNVPMLATEIGTNMVGTGHAEWFTAVTDALADFPDIGVTFFEWNTNGNAFSLCDTNQSLKGGLSGAGLDVGSGAVARP